MRAPGGTRIAVIAAAVVLAGCGGGSKSATSTPSSTIHQTGTFNTSFKAVTGQFKQASAAIGQAIQTAGSRTNAQLAATFGALATRWSGVTRELSGLTPPASVTSEFTALDSAAQRVSHDLLRVSAAAGKNDAAAARAATRSLVNDILAAKGAATTIDSKLGIT
jgi:hypothetical protein